MDAEEKQEIAAIFKHHVEELVERLEQRFDAATAEVKAHVGILHEDFQHKLDVVVEGHEVLRSEIREVREESSAKHGQTAFLLKTLNDKVDTIGADLVAHRKDTEAHGAVWGVKEGGE